jgi:N-acetylmuramoyl-L-alanine amidase
MKISRHRIKEAKQYNSPNKSAEINPDTIVIHYTAGPSAESSVNTFMDPERKVSAHLVVDLDGAVSQLVPFNIKAWHAGKSSHKNRNGLNQYSIGIEIVNAGKLVKSGTVYKSWFGRKYPVEDVMYAYHRNEQQPAYWHSYEEAQITAVEEICRLLTAEYDIKYILGHEEISPGRKTDPGPAFPLDKMRNRILNASSRDDDSAADEPPKQKKGVVTASKLNIRTGPDSSRAKAAKALDKGSEVKILKESDGWYYVSAEVKGWVSAEYIQKS